MACIAVAAISTMASMSLWAHDAQRHPAIVCNLIAADVVEGQEAATGTGTGEVPSESFQRAPLLVS
jgi:hypothetical protein